MIVIVLLIGVSAASPPPSVQCYPEVGCFSNGWPWSSTGRTVPPAQHPLNVSTTFFLYTRETSDCIQVYPEIQNLPIPPNQSVFVIFHSYTFNSTSSPVLNLKDAILNRTDDLVIIPDFNTQGDYEQVVSNGRVVAKLAANVISAIPINSSNVHFIGVQLGAHIAGLTAKVIFESAGSFVGRLTGLDPPRDVFEEFPAEARLNWADADYVEVVHTNGGSYGLLEPIGDADFYINGGRSQPACVNHTNPNLCSHWLSTSYFAEAIASPCLYAMPAETSLDPSDGFMSFTPMPGSSPQQSVLRLDMSEPGLYYIATADNPPFCVLPNYNATVIDAY